MAMRCNSEYAHAQQRNTAEFQAQHFHVFEAMHFIKHQIKLEVSVVTHGDSMPTGSPKRTKNNMVKKIIFVLKRENFFIFFIVPRKRRHPTAVSRELTLRWSSPHITAAEDQLEQ